MSTRLGVKNLKRFFKILAMFLHLENCLPSYKDASFKSLKHFSRKYSRFCFNFNGFSFTFPEPKGSLPFLWTLTLAL